jgi:hypothetical protein
MTGVRLFMTIWLDLANYLIDLVAKHKGVEAQF